MTIYALSSGPGVSGVAVIRVSGKNTSNVVKKLTGSKLPKPRVATFKKFNENGQKKQEGYLGNYNYKQDKWTSWDEDGKKYLEEEYKDGEKNGLLIGWYPNGQKSIEENYKDGKKDGAAYYWYDDGQQKQRGSFINGLKNGKMIYWYLEYELVLK